MKIIGKMNDGTSLMVVETIEAQSLSNLIETALSVIGKMQDILGLKAPEAVPVPAAEEFRDPPPAAKRKPRAKAVKVKKAPRGEVAKYSPRICETCKKEFAPARKDSVCCSKKCNSERHRKLAHKSAARIPRAPVKVTPPAPATSKADRLALIKRLAGRGSSAQVVERSGVAPDLNSITEYQRAQREASHE